MKDRHVAGLRTKAKEEQLLFRDAVHALDAGNYSSLEELLDQPGLSLIDLLVAAGEPKVPMEQAFTWSCMLGRASNAVFLLEKGVDPLAGDNTGLNGFHYAASSGHLGVVKLLIAQKVPLEVTNMYGGTVLGQAVWSAINEPKVDHVGLCRWQRVSEAQFPAPGLHHEDDHRARAVSRTRPRSESGRVF